jgi:hypothetical protein
VTKRYEVVVKHYLKGVLHIGDIQDGKAGARFSYGSMGETAS